MIITEWSGSELSFSLFYYIRLLAQLISQDCWIDNLDESLSAQFHYRSMGLLSSISTQEDWWIRWRIPEEIVKVLRSKSLLLGLLVLMMDHELMQFCFLEKTIINGSYFICHLPDEIWYRRRRESSKPL